jgi:hypothetical protein
MKGKYISKTNSKPPAIVNDKVSSTNEFFNNATIIQINRSVGTDDISELNAINSILSDLKQLDNEDQIEIAFNVKRLVKIIIESQRNDGDGEKSIILSDEEEQLIKDRDREEASEEEEVDYDYDDDNRFDRNDISNSIPFNRKTSGLIEKQTKEVLSNLSS